MGMKKSIPPSQINATGTILPKPRLAFTGIVEFTETLERIGREVQVRIRSFVDVEPGSLIVSLEAVRTEPPPPNGTSAADWPADWLGDLTDLEQEWLEGRAVQEAEVLARAAEAKARAATQKLAVA